MTTYTKPKTPTTKIPQHVRGQYLARCHLSRKQRAKLAAALTDGSITVSPLTVRQSSVIANVPIWEVTKARRANGHGDDRGHDHGHGDRHEHNGETLAQHIARSSATELAETAKAIGVDVLWDRLIVPVLNAAE